MLGLDPADICNKVEKYAGCCYSDFLVVDVGVIRNHGWAVIECNAAFSSGIYGCDPVAVLPVLRRACVPISKTMATTTS